MIQRVGYQMKPESVPESVKRIIVILVLATIFSVAVVLLQPDQYVFVWLRGALEKNWLILSGVFFGFRYVLSYFENQYPGSKYAAVNYIVGGLVSVFKIIGPIIFVIFMFGIVYSYLYVFMLSAWGLVVVLPLLLYCGYYLRLLSSEQSDLESEAPRSSLWSKVVRDILGAAFGGLLTICLIISVDFMFQFDIRLGYFWAVLLIAVLVFLFIAFGKDTPSIIVRVFVGMVMIVLLSAKPYSIDKNIALLRAGELNIPDIFGATPIVATTTPTNTPVYPVLFGPESGELKHKDVKTAAVFCANVRVQNFIAEVDLYNPYTKENLWDYGVQFRHIDWNNGYRVTISSRELSSAEIKNRLGFGCFKDGSKCSDIQERWISNVNTLTNGYNKLSIKAIDNRVDIWVNEVKVYGETNLKNVAGDICVGSGFLGGIEAGQITRYENFKISQIP